MKTNIFIALLIVFFVSCQNTQSTSTKEDGAIEKIVIHFYPAFIVRSEIIFDSSDSSVIFQHLGGKTLHYWNDVSNSFANEKAPTSFRYKLNKDNYTYLTDSIHYSEDDFIDRQVDANDGIFNTILYISNDGTLRDVDLRNDLTKNQYLLITNLINASIANAPDSLTSNYLNKLIKYYPYD